MEQRMQKVRNSMQQRGIDGFLIFTGENRRYLSGLGVEDHQFDEISAALLITDKDQLLITDSRFDLQAKHETTNWEVIIYKQSLSIEIGVLSAKLGIKSMGFESHRISVQRFREIEEEIGKLTNPPELIPLSDLVENLRLIKDQSEIDLTRKALSLAESAYTQMVEQVRPGMSEKQIAWNLEKKMNESGMDGLSFPVIVATGPNSALPHAVPTNRTLNVGEPLLIDWGCKLNGYCSDTTRTIILGQPDDTFLKVYHCVLEAQKRAIDLIKSGISAKIVDAAARDFIHQSGFEGKFGHGLGHGTGLAVHESPRLSPKSQDILEEGMIVTVEPGIYLPNWGGVRIEHQVLVRNEGAEIINQLSTTYNISQL